MGPRAVWTSAKRDAVDRVATRMLKKTEMFGGKGFKRPRLKLGCSTIGEDEVAFRKSEKA